MEFIDLSMPIEPHYRWGFSSELASDYKKGDPYQSTLFTMSAHAFTHIDAPLHFEPGAQTIDAVPLNRLVGPAAILDLMPVAPNQAISASDLKKSAAHLAEGDIVIFKTGWDLKMSWKSREFWTKAPFLNEGAVAWLSGQKIKAVGFDFPQDYAIREIPDRQPTPEEMPSHNLILRKGIYMIEYLCNVHRITADRVVLFALPLKLAGCEGAPARVVAVEEF